MSEQEQKIIFTPYRQNGTAMPSVEATPVIFKGYEQFNFVISRMTYESDKSWHRYFAISELLTGQLIDVGLTPKSAKRNALAKLKKKTIRQIKSRIKQFMPRR